MPGQKISNGERKQIHKTDRNRFPSKHYCLSGLEGLIEFRERMTDVEVAQIFFSEIDTKSSHLGIALSFTV